MKYLLFAALVVLGAAALYLLVCILLGLYAILSAIRPMRVPPENTRQNDIRNGCPECFDDYDNLWDRHDFTLETHKATISGEYIINPDSPPGRKKVAVICHGHTVSRAATLKYGRIFYSLGYNLVIFDERYFGKSTAKFCTLGMNESQDVKRIIEFAREIFGEDAFIGLHGESMGAATSLLVLGLEKPDFVVADCPFGVTRKLMAHITRKRIRVIPPEHILAFARIFGIMLCGYDLQKVNPIDVLAEADVPVCLVHGLCDTFVPCEHSRMMAQVFRHPDSRLHLVPGAGHARSISIDRPGYEKLIEEFVRTAEEKYL